MALIETVRGLLDLRVTAALRGVGRLAFGSIDFSLDAGMADGIDEPDMTMARATIVLASRQAGLARRLAARADDRPAGDRTRAPARGRLKAPVATCLAKTPTIERWQTRRHLRHRAAKM